MKNCKNSLCALLFLVLGGSCLSVRAQNEDGKPSFHAGVLMQGYAVAEQKGFSGEANEDWASDMTLYRLRFLVESQVTKKDYLFIQTNMTSPYSLNKPNTLGMRVLEAQYDHTFNDHFVVSAGKMMVSHTRDPLLSAGRLLLEDFAYYQCAYTDALHTDAGRDVGVNLWGTFNDRKFKYSVAAYAGKRDFEGQKNAPFRKVGRLEYNFMDIDRGRGSNLGEGKTLTVGGGFDTQGSYVAAGGDVFFDYPLGAAGSLTAVGGFTYQTGGNDLKSKYSFATAIPTQNVQLLELGYYIKACKLQPWVRYERQDINSQDNQRGKLTASDFDELNTNTLVGGGFTYFFNKYATCLKLSYLAVNKGVQDTAGKVSSKTHGQLMLQLQVFTF
ncbi:hypothetical protein Barb6_00421 [Bacteroidales bacterium Barb6]|nr:hypothetical protein Barb6_00421 [Bacteroidales bacterium Barb6]